MEEKAADRPPFGPEDRLQLALAQSVVRQLRETGAALVFDSNVATLGSELGVQPHLVEHAISRMTDRLLLLETSPRLYNATRLAIWYQETYERDAWRDANRFRREVLAAAAAARTRNEYLTYNEGNDQFTDRSYSEAAYATRVLDAYDLLEMHEFMGHSFYAKITPDGFDLARDHAALAARLPITATEDETAHAYVAPDVLHDVIRSVEQLLEQRGWSSALRELHRGDEQHAERHWSDAVSEYYAAVESGLKYRLADRGIEYSSGASLRDLARHAAAKGLIPSNYQALFAFLDSVRSPRKHGAGPAVEEVEIGPAESLLMANHARSLLVYLAHRP